VTGQKAEQKKIYGEKEEETDRGYNDIP